MLADRLAGRVRDYHMIRYFFFPYPTEFPLLSPHQGCGHSALCNTAKPVREGGNLLRGADERELSIR